MATEEQEMLMQHLEKLPLVDVLNMRGASSTTVVALLHVDEKEARSHYKDRCPAPYRGFKPNGKKKYIPSPVSRYHHNVMERERRSRISTACNYMKVLLTRGDWAEPDKAAIAELACNLLLFVLQDEEVTKVADQFFPTSINPIEYVNEDRLRQEMGLPCLTQEMVKKHPAGRKRTRCQTALALLDMTQENVDHHSQGDHTMAKEETMYSEMDTFAQEHTFYGNSLLGDDFPEVEVIPEIESCILPIESCILPIESLEAHMIQLD